MDYADYPNNYAGLPLSTFDLKLLLQIPYVSVKIVATKLQLDLLNKYRQYFVRRGESLLIPSQSQTVLDCGACIGDMSILFAALVGSKRKSALI